MKRISIITSIVAALALSLNCDFEKVSAAEAKAWEPTDASIAAGKKLFQGNGTCHTCHGMDGKGDTPTGKALKARNLLSQKYKQGNSLYGIFQTMVKGVPGTGMAMAPVSSDLERLQLAQYVYSISNKKQKMTKAEIGKMDALFPGTAQASAPTGAAPKEPKPPVKIIQPFPLQNLIRTYQRVAKKKIADGKTPQYGKVSKKQKKKFKAARKANGQGAFLYAKNCASCHGNKGQGKVYKSLGVNPYVPLHTKPIAKLKGYNSVGELKKTMQRLNRGQIKSDMAHLNENEWKQLQGFVSKLK